MSDRVINTALENPHEKFCFVILFLLFLPGIYKFPYALDAERKLDAYKTSR